MLMNKSPLFTLSVIKNPRSAEQIRAAAPSAVQRHQGQNYQLKCSLYFVQRSIDIEKKTSTTKFLWLNSFHYGSAESPRRAAQVKAALGVCLCDISLVATCQNTSNTNL